MLRLGLSSGALYPEVATEDAPAVAASYGFTDIELVLQTAGEYQSGFVNELKTRVDVAGCQVHSLHSYQSLHLFVTPYRRREDEAYSLFRQGIEAAANLGAKAIVWHGLSRNEFEASCGWDELFRITSKLASYCADAGISLAIENVSWCAIRSVRDVLLLASRIPELAPVGSLGFAFDPFQASEAGANPFMILQAMEGSIIDCHLSDHRPGEPATRHRAPGDGNLPWPALIRAIAASGYDGPMMIEGPVQDESTAGRVRALLDPLISGISSAGDPCAGFPPAGVLEGIALFNDRKFYEAHEALEHEWHAERRPLRRFYQGILQIGVGFHHAQGGNHKGAVLLLTDGIEKVGGFSPVCQGVDTARLLRESQCCLDAITTLGATNLNEFNWDVLPRIHFVTCETEPQL